MFSCFCIFYSASGVSFLMFLWICHSSFLHSFAITLYTTICLVIPKSEGTYFVFGFLVLQKNRCGEYFGTCGVFRQSILVKKIIKEHVYTDNLFLSNLLGVFVGLVSCTVLEGTSGTICYKSIHERERTTIYLTSNHSVCLKTSNDV